MNRATWLQDRRMQKFRDVLSRWDRGELSMLEAGELLGMSERQFRRYRDRYEEDGLEGLIDRRLGKPSARRVPARELELMLELYRDCYRGWNVKHFHEHLVRDHNFQWGYTWVKTQLHTAGLVERATRRGALDQPRRVQLRLHPGVAPLEVMVAHQMLVKMLHVPAAVAIPVQLQHQLQLPRRDPPRRRLAKPPVDQSLKAVLLVAVAIAPELPLRHAQQLARLQHR